MVPLLIFKKKHVVPPYGPPFDFEKKMHVVPPYGATFDFQKKTCGPPLWSSF